VARVVLAEAGSGGRLSRVVVLLFLLSRLKEALESALCEHPSCLQLLLLETLVLGGLVIDNVSLLQGLSREGIVSFVKVELSDH